MPKRAQTTTLGVMDFPLKARVKNGRLVLDVPTDLPEVEEVELTLHDPGDELDDAERAELHRELRASLAEADAGELIDGEEVIAEIRARGAG
jgi:hypothetical protein